MNEKNSSPWGEGIVQASWHLYLVPDHKKGLNHVYVHVLKITLKISLDYEWEQVVFIKINAAAQLLW